MYIIQIKFKGETVQDVSLSLENSNEGSEKFHSFLYMLEKSDLVCEFRLSDAAGVISQDCFGYGRMEKWVNKFSYGKN